MKEQLAEYQAHLPVFLDSVRAQLAALTQLPAEVRAGDPGHPLANPRSMPPVSEPHWSTHGIYPPVSAPHWPPH